VQLCVRGIRACLAFIRLLRAGRAHWPDSAFLLGPIVYFPAVMQLDRQPPRVGQQQELCLSLAAGESQRGYRSIHGSWRCGAPPPGHALTLVVTERVGI
jgi:hypothetical protein